MTKLEQLIQELCPNGVEYKKVKEVYVEPNSVFNEYIAPQLIDEKINLITATCKKNIYVKVEEDDNIIYENTDSTG